MLGMHGFEARYWPILNAGDNLPSNESVDMKDKGRGDAGTSLDATWSLQDYLRWQREQEERDDALREASNKIVLARFDPECEAAVRALEEGGWGKGFRPSMGRNR